MSTTGVSPTARGSPKARRPPPPKPLPYKTQATPTVIKATPRENKSEVVEEAAPTKSKLPVSQAAPTRNEATAGNHMSGSISPSVLAKIDHRPRLNTPVFDESDSHSSMPTPTYRTSTPPPPSSPLIRSTLPPSFSPPPPPSPERDDDRATVTSQAGPVAPNSYTEVAVMSLVTQTPPTANVIPQDDDTVYDVTSHMTKPPQLPPGTPSGYSSLNQAPEHKRNLVGEDTVIYDIIDQDDEIPLPTGGKPSSETSPKPQSPSHKPPHLATSINRARSPSPKPPLPPPFKKTPSPSQKPSTSPSHSSKTPPIKPPRPASPSMGPLPNRPKPPVAAKPLVLSKPTGRSSPTPPSPQHTAVSSPGKSPLILKQEEEELTKDTAANHACEIDIDAIILRSPIKQTETTPTVGDKAPPTTQQPPRMARRHVYDDVNELLMRPRSNSLNDKSTISTGNDNSGKKPKDPPRRKAPPPPIPKGSPPLQRKFEPPPESKSLTLGRKPRSDLQMDDFENEDSSNQLGIKKSPMASSPGIKSKLKTFFRSRDDGTFTGRGSLRRSKKSSPLVHITSPVDTTSKSITLPAGARRPRGKSVDPYMSAGITSGYSLVTMGSEDDDPLQQAAPYTIIDIDSVALRMKPGNRSMELRRSRSVEHLYESAQFGSRTRRSPSPLVRSPSIPDAIDDDLDTHIYASIDKTRKRKKSNNEETKEQEEPKDEPATDAIVNDFPPGNKVDSPPPPVPPFNAHSPPPCSDHVYAVVSKTGSTSDPQVDTATTSPAHHQLDTSCDSQLRGLKKTPPPVPRPYEADAQNVPTVNPADTEPSEPNVPDMPTKPVVPPTQSVTPPTQPAVMTTPTQSGNKYSYLLKKKLPPPSHTPPSPPAAGSVDDDAASSQPLLKPKAYLQPAASIDIKRARHDYEQIDFDNPSSSSSSCSPAASALSLSLPPQIGKLRELKPKDRPAPPPPPAFMKRTRASDDSKIGSHNVSPARHGKYSIDSLSPHFLFSDNRVGGFIEAGDSSQSGPPLSPSASSGTISSAMDVNEDDSDMSSDWDPSSDEDDEKKQQKVPKSKIFYIAQEILTTERTFVKGLKLLHQDFRQHMMSANSAHEKQVVSEETLSQILSNIGSLYMLNSELLKELEERMHKWDTEPRLGDIFVKRAPYLKLYSQYISNFDVALKTLEEQQKKNPVFAQVVKDFELEPKCANLTVAAYLLETVQRIPRYKMLLADYIKHLPTDSSDKLDSEKALGIISSVATHVNETIRQMDNFRKTVEVSKRLIGDVGDSLLSPHRKLLKEGELVKSSRKEKQPRMFFLFTDLLIYASAIPPANTTFRVIKRIPLDGMKVQTLDDPELKNGFQIISTCKSFRLDASTGEEKLQWLQAFETAIKDHTQRVKSRQLFNRRSMITDWSDGEVDAPDGGGTLGSLAPPWLPDSSVSMCQLCSIHFTVTRRRHHCRACGLIFCGECSSYVAPLPYKNNKLSRVCQTCYSTLTEGADELPQMKPVTKRRPLRTSQKKISMPSVLREVRARDQNAQISGYLFYREDKSRQWKRKWFVVYDLVMYEFKRHEDVSAQRSVPLPSYIVTSPVPEITDPLVFSLQHSGAGRVLFKTEDKEQLDNWVDVLFKAVRGEVAT